MNEADSVIAEEKRRRQELMLKAYSRPRESGGGAVTSAHIAPVSKASTPNPKDLFGSQKVSLSKVPAIAIAHEAHAMMDGAERYGAFNWRDKPVIASIYVDACLRHLQAWFDGEEEASDSGVHHLGHSRACLGILLDAQETGNLIDDRPVKPGAPSVFARVLARLNAKIAAKKAA